MAVDDLALFLLDDVRIGFEAGDHLVFSGNVFAFLVEDFTHLTPLFPSADSGRPAAGEERGTVTRGAAARGCRRPARPVQKPNAGRGGRRIMRCGLSVSASGKASASMSHRIVRLHGWPSAPRVLEVREPPFRSHRRHPPNAHARRSTPWGVRPGFCPTTLWKRRSERPCAFSVAQVTSWGFLDRINKGAQDNALLRGYPHPIRKPRAWFLAHTQMYRNVDQLLSEAARDMR